MIWGYVGLLGHGKTTGMTAQGNRFSKQGRKIYSNYRTSFSELINPLDLLEFKLSNAVVMLDEIYSFLDSRMNTNAQRYMTYFGFQMRKRDIDMLWTAQLSSSVDKRMRELTDRKILCVRQKEGFMYVCLDGYGQYLGTNFISNENARRVWPMFDTHEVIMPMELDTRTSVEDIKVLMGKCPTKKSFVTAVRVLNPYLPIDTCESIWDLLKIGEVGLVEKMLKRI